MISTAFVPARKTGTKVPFAKFCKKNFYKLADKFTETHFVDGASDFRTFRSRVKDAILSMGEYYRFSKGFSVG